MCPLKCEEKSYTVIDVSLFLSFNVYACVVVSTHYLIPLFD